jgi:hypothetical protein
MIKAGALSSLCIGRLVWPRKGPAVPTALMLLVLFACPASAAVVPAPSRTTVRQASGRVAMEGRSSEISVERICTAICIRATLALRSASGEIRAEGRKNEMQADRRYSGCARTASRMQ